MPYPGVISLSVEVSAPGRPTVLVGGELTDATGTALLHLVRETIVMAGRTRDRVVVVDLAGVGRFAPDGMGALHRARRAADEAGVTLRLTGLDERWPLLPDRVRRTLADLCDPSPAGPRGRPRPPGVTVPVAVRSTPTLSGAAVRS